MKENFDLASQDAGKNYSIDKPLVVGVKSLLELSGRKLAPGAGNYSSSFFCDQAVMKSLELDDDFSPIEPSLR